MAMDFNKDSLIIVEGVWEQGSWASPEAIDGTADPFTQGGWTKTGDIGYFKRGTLKGNMPREFARFESGTPKKLIRIDLIGKDLMIEASLAQYDIDQLQIVQGLLTITDDPYYIAFIGTDHPTPAYYGARIKTRHAGTGDPFYICLWSGIYDGEDNSFAPSGTEHSTYAARLTATPGPTFDPSDLDDDQKNLGMLLRVAA